MAYDNGLFICFVYVGFLLVCFCVFFWRDGLRLLLFLSLPPSIRFASLPHRICIFPHVRCAIGWATYIEQCRLCCFALFLLSFRFGFGFWFDFGCFGFLDSFGCGRSVLDRQTVRNFPRLRGLNLPRLAVGSKAMRDVPYNVLMTRIFYGVGRLS